MAPPLQFTDWRLMANSAVCEVCMDFDSCWRDVEFSEDEESSLPVDKGVKVGGAEAAAGESTHSEARFSMTMVDGEGAILFRRSSSSRSVSPPSSSSEFKRDVVGLGVKMELLRRFLRCWRRRWALETGCNGSSSHSAKMDEFRFVSTVISSSSGTTFF
jgi:hypothetical protein